MPLLVLVMLLLLSAPASASVSLHGHTSFSNSPKAGPAFRAAATASSRLQPGWGGLPAGRCGQPDRYYTSPKPEIVFAVVRPEGFRRRFARIAEDLQVLTSLTARFVANSTDGQRTLRYATGIACGRPRVVVFDVELPHPASHYQTGPEEVDLWTLADDTFAELAGHVGPMSEIALAVDGLDADAMGYYVPPRDDSRPGFGMSFVGVPYEDEWLLRDPVNYAEVMLHELFHSLGAVEDDSPHATGAGHCNDGVDLMCAEDDGPASDLFRACPRLWGFFVTAIDCGADDYFAVAPAPASPLANGTVANLYDSPLMTTCASAPRACGHTRPHPVRADGGSEARVEVEVSAKTGALTRRIIARVRTNQPARLCLRAGRRQRCVTKGQVSFEDGAPDGEPLAVTATATATATERSRRGRVLGSASMRLAD